MLGGNPEFVPRKAEVSSDESLTLLGGKSEVALRQALRQAQGKLRDRKGRR